MLLSHGCSSRGILCLLFTRIVAEVTVFSHEFSFCPELSNLRIGLFSHGASRMVTVLLSRDLSFGPTDQREVICELSNFFSHGESRRVTGGARIIVFLSSHGESRRVSGFMSRIIELSNFFSHGESRRVTAFCHELSNFFSHGESRRFSLSRDMFFVTNLRISFFTRNVADVAEVMRVEL